jgi:hypothetical protein
MVILSGIVVSSGLSVCLAGGAALENRQITEDSSFVSTRFYNILISDSSRPMHYRDTKDILVAIKSL